MAGGDAIRARIDEEEVRLWGLGMHSIIFVSDEPGESAAVLVSRCKDHVAAAVIAEAIVGEALVRVDSLRFDEPEGRPAWLVATAPSPRPARKQRRRREPAAMAA